MTEVYTGPVACGTCAHPQAWHFQGSGRCEEGCPCVAWTQGLPRVELGRRALVARILSARPRCEAGTKIHSIDPAHMCTRESVDVHELLARSAGGSILDEANCIAVCRRCHEWIGQRPKLALALGLRVSRYSQGSGVKGAVTK